MTEPVAFPQRVEIELSAVCNFKCVYCPRRFVEGLGGFMDVSLFHRLVDEVASHPGRIVVLHRRGESLLHPHAARMLHYVAGKFDEVQMATNGSVMSQEIAEALMAGVDFLSFSLDPPATFEQVRGFDYAKVRANVHFLLEQRARAGSNMRIQASMVRTGQTLPENVEAFKAEWEGKVDRIRIYEEHSADGRFGALTRDRGERKPCVMPGYQTLIWVDGKVGRCNHDWDGVPLGDVTAATIAEVWGGPAYQDLRQQHRELCFTDATCSECDSWYPEVGKQGTGEVIEK